MPTPVWCELVCGSCATTSEGQHAFGRLPTQALKKQAKRHGWVFTRDEVYCSEKCKKEATKC